MLGLPYGDGSRACGRQAGSACIHSIIRWVGTGTGGWSGVREKYFWLAGGWKLMLERCKKKTLLGWRVLELPNRVNEDRKMHSCCKTVNERDRSSLDLTWDSEISDFDPCNATQYNMLAIDQHAEMKRAI